MENLFLLAILATILFLFIKFVEMKYLDKEFKPLKLVIRDGIIVFVSTIAASYSFFYMNGSIKDFFNVITENKALQPDATQIFTDTPAF
jgi:hypothetical protein